VKLFDSQAARGSVSIGLTADRKRDQIIGFDRFAEPAITSEAVASVTGEQIQVMDRNLTYRCIDILQKKGVCCQETE
jgi:hypothetical protein